MEPVESGALTPLQAARLDKGWKAAKLAAELGVSDTTLSRWENGRQQPTLGHQQRLCEVLDKAPVEHLEAVTATHRQLYHHLSSLELVDPVTGHLRGVTRLLRGASSGCCGVVSLPSPVRRPAMLPGCSMIWATRS
jgi:DNA-binding XRE family transcriptional regulator